MKASARERLLDAADELFYAEGIHTVGIDRVIERAGVAKASLYSAFGSKEELVRAYLVRRMETRQIRITAAVAAHTEPREKILAIYDNLGAVARNTGFRGCAFINATAESPPGSAADEVTTALRNWVRAVFVELTTAFGAADPVGLAGQLVVLYDGTIVGTRLDRDPLVAQTSRIAAAALLDAASRSGAASRSDVASHPGDASLLGAASGLDSVPTASG